MQQVAVVVSFHLCSIFSFSLSLISDDWEKSISDRDLQARDNAFRSNQYQQKIIPLCFVMLKIVVACVYVQFIASLEQLFAQTRDHIASISLKKYNIGWMNIKNFCLPLLNQLNHRLLEWMEVEIQTNCHQATITVDVQQLTETKN